MKYHYRTGTGRQLRKRRIRYASASSLLVVCLCTSFVVTQGDKVESLRNIRRAVKDTQSSKQRQRPATTNATVKATSTTAVTQNGSCAIAEKHSGLQRSAVSQLRKLAEYETVCSGQVAGNVSFFVPTPTTVAEAKEQGQDTAGILQEFAAFGVKPLVFIEPATTGGAIVDINTYTAGGYDAALDAYFAAIKNEGISDTQMGTWNPLPEWNIPVWGDTNPNTFAALITRTVQLQKKHFPTSKASILLESKSYPAGNSWENGRYVSLLPYVQNIPRGLIDSFGLQGFTWGSSGPYDPALLDPAVYLRTDLAIEAAKSLGTAQVWLNTGTYATFAKTNPVQALTPAQRQTILSGVLTAAKSIQAAGFSSAIHIFAQNKLSSAEKIDWSYWHPDTIQSSPSTPLFKTFATDAKAANISLWLYDTDKTE